MLLFSDYVNATAGTALVTPSLNKYMFTFQSCKDQYQSDDILEYTHETCKANALKTFDQQPKFGDGKLVEKHRTKLNTTICQEFAVFEQSNKAQLVRVYYIFLHKSLLN